MSERYTHRETYVISPAQLNQEFLRPESIRIQLDKTVRAAPLDIGCLAYAAWTRNVGQEDRSNLVDKLSFIRERRELLRSIFFDFSITQNHRTILHNVYRFEAAIKWCDENGHSDFFRDEMSAVLAYQGYTQYLNDRIARKEIVPVTANNFQRAMSKLIEYQFPSEHLAIIRSAIPVRSQRGNSKPPREQNVTAYLKTCLTLARRISEFVIKGGSYPLVVNLDGFDVVHFPSNHGTLTPFKKQDVRSYNLSELRISTVEEYVERALRSGVLISAYNAQEDLASAHRTLSSANSDLRCHWRIRLASLAMQAYTNILLILLGATASELIQFDYEESLELERSLVKKELSAIKFRAKGLKTRYALGRDGVHLLKEYLVLRAWVLDGQEFDKLFLMVSVNGKDAGEIRPLRLIFSQAFYKRISGVYLDPMCPNISSRGIRKHKSVVLHSLGISPATVADVLNHTVNTNIKDYLEASIEQQEDEFGIYWQSVRRAAERAIENRDSQGTATASGHCDAFLRPAPESDVTALQPNCRTQYSCLYCKHYSCHADQEDIHKLLSLQYVANSVRASTPDLDHAEALYKDLCIRIEYITDEISKRSPESAEIVSSIKYKVGQLGVLTVFWENWMQRYEKMGVVF